MNMEEKITLITALEFKGVVGNTNTAEQSFACLHCHVKLKVYENPVFISISIIFITVEVVQSYIMNRFTPVFHFILLSTCIPLHFSNILYFLPL